MSKHTFVTVGILVGLVVGAIAGELLYWAYEGSVPAVWLDWLSFGGKTFFIGLLKMVLIPLIASSVIVGVAAIGDPSKLGLVGGLTVVYYFSTMLIAVVIGVALVSMVKPGDPNRDGSGIGKEVIDQGQAAFTTDFSEEKKEDLRKRGSEGLAGAFRNIVEQIVPSNVVKAASEGQMLPVISFSLLFGIVLTIIGDRAKIVLEFFKGMFAIIMLMVEWILWLAPIGVCLLVAWTVARIGTTNLVGPLFKYVLVVVGGLLLHGVVVLPAVLWMFGRANPYQYLWQMKDALMTAFGTDSSSASTLR